MSIRRSVVRVVLTTVAFCASILGSAPVDPGGSAGLAFGVEPDGIRFFESNIRPLLADNCYSCHGAEKQESGLRLDTSDALIAGGDSGELLVPGEPDYSLLLIAIQYVDDDLQMPPDGKLTDAQISHVRKWIAAGAPHPDLVPSKVANPGPESAPSYWAFEPPARPLLPEVGDTNWSKTPVDRFILARLEREGLSPTKRAPKRILIRRATFDLLGLPPTANEINAFLSDDSPDAFERVVDRLLGSARYGERWGRHWLDVARYADSNGLDENIAHGNAWRYRDYVIGAMNSDKPFDQFMTEQLAGDLLVQTAGDETGRFEKLTATGFLSLGPKVLAEGDQAKMEMDIIDEQIDTLGRAFLGMTLGCARCHDHKFDPISTEDYYALAGIFKSTRTMESLKRIAKWNENSLATAEEQGRNQDRRERIATLERSIKEQEARPRETRDQRASSEDDTGRPLAQLREELASLKAVAAELPTAMGVQEGEVTDIRVHIRGNHLTLGKVVPRGFPEMLSPAGPLAVGKASSGRLELASWLKDAENPLVSRVMVNRIWRWHFGRGLVSSVDNFGKLGDAPANQPLLDWLAREFIARDWSVKGMHRVILLSATYQMGSELDNQSAEIDPANSNRWRTDIRRLEAEAVRDALLEVSGLIDYSMGGSLLHVKNREFLFDHTSKDETNYSSRKRSVYLPIVRNHLYDVFSLFDYSDASVPNGDRAQSTVAPQALFMMNSELLMEASDALAGLALQAPRNGVDQRLQWLYGRLFGRMATEAELERGRRFLTRLLTEESVNTSVDPKSGGREHNAWAGLCHVLLSTNEFIYVR